MDTSKVLRRSTQKPAPGIGGWLLGLLLLSGAIFASVTLIDSASVRSNPELLAVSLGWPFDWLTQSQSISPPLPYQARLLSPWEHPVTVHAGPLLANVILTAGIAGAVLAISYLLRRALYHR